MDGEDGNRLKLEKIANSQVKLCLEKKNCQNIIMVCAICLMLFDIFFVILQEHFVYE